MHPSQSRYPNLTRDLREAFADIDPENVAILARLSEARRLAMVGELADFARQSYVIQERQVDPDAPDEVIQARVVQRMLSRGRG